MSYPPTIEMYIVCICGVGGFFLILLTWGLLRKLSCLHKVLNTIYESPQDKASRMLNELELRRKDKLDG